MITRFRGDWLTAVALVAAFASCGEGAADNATPRSGDSPALSTSGTPPPTTGAPESVPGTPTLPGATPIPLETMQQMEEQLAQDWGVTFDDSTGLVAVPSENAAATVLAEYSNLEGVEIRSSRLVHVTSVAAQSAAIVPKEGLEVWLIALAGFQDPVIGPDGGETDIVRDIATVLVDATTGSVIIASFMASAQFE